MSEVVIFFCLFSFLLLLKQAYVFSNLKEIPIYYIWIDEYVSCVILLYDNI